MNTQRGFTLVELMVGLAIGLIGLLVVMQTLTSVEGQKRTTSAGMDAQSTGAMALFEIERQAKMAGYGMTSLQNALNCEIRIKNDADANYTSFNLRPINIVDGASGAPDTIQIMGSSTTNWALPIQITVDHPPQAANFFVDSDIGVTAGDLMLAVPQNPDVNNWCTVIEATQTGSGSGGSGGGQGQNQVQHNPSGIWNPPGGQNIMPTSGYGAGDYLINLGQLNRLSYQISSELNLQESVFSTSSNTTITSDKYPSIVNLQAQYGLDNGASGGTADDGIVDQYTATSPTTNAGWRQVLTVRFAILSRSSQWERENVTTTAPSWAGGSFTMSNVTDWQRFRYRVFETVVPLRNVIWHS